MTIVKRRKGTDWVQELLAATNAWGYGGTGTAKNAASAPLIDLDALGVPRCLWLPGTVGNHVSTPDVNEIDYDSSTFENSIGKWEGLNKNFLTSNQSSVETDTTGWIAFMGNVGFARSTAQALTGTASLAITANSSADVAVHTTSIPVVPGQVYTVTGAFRAAGTGRRVFIGTHWRTSADVAMTANTSSGVSDNSVGWTVASHTVQAPASAAFVRVYAYVLAPITGEVHYLDQVGLFETPNGNLAPAGGDFENGLGEWAFIGSGGGSASLGPVAAYTGRQGVRVVAATNGHQLRQGQISQVCLPNRTYTASMWVRVESGAGSVNMLVEQWTAGGSYVTNVPSSSTNSTSWTRLSVTFTTGATIERYNLSTNTTGAVTFYIDAVQMVLGSTAVEYLPPNTYNLIRNPGFEGTNGWVHRGGGSGGQGVSTTVAYTGTKSYFAQSGTGQQISVRQGGVYEGVGTAADHSIQVTPGDILTFSAYFRSATGFTGNWRVGAEWTTSTGFFNESFGPSVFVPAGQWTRVVSTVVVPAGVSGVCARFDAQTASAQAYVDAYQVERGSVATPYTEGTLGVGYGWESSENLIPNGSFETDTAGWEGLNKNLLTASQSSFETDAGTWFGRGNSSVARSTAQALVGTASLAVTATAASNGETACFVSSGSGTADRVAVVPGSVITVIASSRAGSTGRRFGVQVDWHNSSGNTVGYARNMSGVDNFAGWNQAVLVVQVPADARSVFVTVLWDTVAAGEIHYVDAVGVFETPNENLVPNSDFDKGTTGWSGAAGAASTISTSAVQSYAGQPSMLVTWPSAAVRASAAFTSIPLIAGDTYTFSMWVYVPTGSPDVEAYIYSAGTGSASLGTLTSVKDAWTRITVTRTITTSGTYSLGVQNSTAATAGQQVYVDAVQLVVGSVALDYVPPTTDNLATNPSFEVLAPWQASSASIALSSTWKHVGANSLALTAGGASTDCFANPGNDNIVGVYQFGMEPGRTYTVSAYLYVPPTYSKAGEHITRARGINVHCRKGDGTYLFFDSNKIEPGNSGRVSVTFTIPTTGTVNAFIRLYNGSAVAGNVVYWDAFQVEQGSFASSYIDGSLGTGYTWEASQNLLSAENSSYEGGTAGAWINNGQGTTITSDTTQFYTGTRSLRVVPGAENWGYLEAISTAKLIPGLTYTFSTWVRSDAAQTVRLTNYNTPAHGPSVTLAANTWTRLILTQTIPVGATNVWLSVRRPDGTMASAFFMDALQIEQRDYATAYAAAGTANASTSKRQNPWVLGGTSQEALASVVGNPKHGTKMISASLDGLPNAPGYETRVTVLPVTTYTLSLNVTNGSQTVLGSTIRVLDAATNDVLVTRQHDAGVMPRYALTFTTGGSTTAVRVQILRNGSTRPGDTAPSADAVQLEQKSYATVFGSIGTEHDSVSSRQQQPWILGGTSRETVSLQFGSGLQHEASKLMQVDFTPRADIARWGVQLPVALVSGQVYTFSIGMYEANADGFRPTLDVLMPSGTLVVGPSRGAQAEAKVRASITFTADATGTGYLRVRSAHPVYGRLRLDAAELERGSTASSYTLPARITSDIDLRFHGALEDWSPSANMNLLAKWDNEYSYALTANTSGQLSLDWWDETNTARAAGSVAHGLADGARKHVRATLDVDNGASGRTIRFYTSDDGITWTQLGADIVQAGVTSIRSTVAVLRVGCRDAAGNGSVKGKVISAEVRAGINGTVVASYEAVKQTVNQFSVRDTLAPWTGQANSSATGIKDPDSGTRAWRVTFDATNANKFVAVANTLPYLAVGVQHSFSIWMRSPSGNRTVHQSIEGSGSGAVGYGYTPRTVTPTWERFTMTFTPGSAHNTKPLLYAFTQAGAFDLEVWGPQIEVGGTATPLGAITNTASDTTGKVWTINRSGEASAEVVDRSTFAFTGSEFMTLPDRDALSVSIQWGLVARVFTRGSAASNRIIEHGGYSTTVANNNPHYEGAQAKWAIGPTGGPVLNGPVRPATYGAWETAAWERSGTSYKVGINSIFGTPGTGSATEINPAQYMRIGGINTGSVSNWRGFIPWLIIFRRILTAAEHAELTAWDGRIVTEPQWIRTAAALYINADDPAQRAQYTATNTVINLEAGPQRKVAGAFQSQVILRMKNGAWV